MYPISVTSRLRQHVFLCRPLFLFPLDTGIRLAHNAIDWLAESVTNPSPASLSDLLFHRHLTCALLQPFIADNFWPPDTEDSSSAAVDKGRYPLCCGHSGPPYYLLRKEEQEQH